jgi:hypothetical protein
MSDIQCVLLESEEDIVRYEELLYDMFTKKAPDNWIHSHYELIDGNRLRCGFIPLQDQAFCAAKRNGTILAGMSANLKCTGELQLEKLGFCVDRTDPAFCEGLTLYRTDDGDVNLFLVLEQLMTFVIDNLKTIGVRTMYMTCIDRLVRMYELFGFELRESITKDGVQRNLMSYRVE